MARNTYNPRLPLVGDPSPVMPPVYNDDGILGEVRNRVWQGERIEDILEGMNEQQLFNFALASGHKVTDLLSITHCYEHVNMILLTAASKMAGLKYSVDVKWCTNCYQYWRTKTVPKVK